MCDCLTCQLIDGGNPDDPIFETMWPLRDSSIRSCGWYMAASKGRARTFHVDVTFNHPNFDLHFPGLPYDICMDVMVGIMRKVKHGHRFKPGQIVDEVLDTYSVRIIDSPVGQGLLRIILPDPNGLVLEEDMEPAYAEQYTLTGVPYSG